MKKLLFCIFLFLVILAVFLSACGIRQAATPAESPAEELSAQEESPTEETPVPTPTPTPVVDLTFPDGSIHPSDAASLQLLTLTHDDIANTLPQLKQMTGLVYLDLGSETADVPSADGVSAEQQPRDLSWDDIRAIQEACPNVGVRYAFTLWGKTFTTLDTKMDLNHIKMNDEGAAVREVLPCMTNCKVLDMDFCGVDSEHMAEIRNAYPDMDVIWRIWFGNDCSVRTDTERILASNLNHVLTDANTKDLKYCTKIRLLDVGHNGGLTDFNFLREMPDLEVLIVSLCGFSDFTVLENCKNLEFFEFCSYWQGYDVGPLGDLTNLEHVNICGLGKITGWERLENLKKLQRLWIGQYTILPEGAIEELQAALPDTEINITEKTGCLGTWREAADGSFVPRYEKLREQFQYDDYPHVCSSWFNDPKYYG